MATLRQCFSMILTPCQAYTSYDWRTKLSKLSDVLKWKIAFSMGLQYLINPHVMLGEHKERL